MLNLEPIGEAAYAQLSKLAQDIYQEHYLHLWLPGGADWYMYTYAYAPEIIRQELRDPDNFHYWVYHENKLTGYLKLRLAESLPGESSGKTLEIERIYLHKAQTGKGIGREIMQFCESIARNNNCAVLFLKAMDSSKDAIRFYQNQGYQISGNLRLLFPLLKEAFRGMYILRKNLV